MGAYSSPVSPQDAIPLEIERLWQAIRDLSGAAPTNSQVIADLGVGSRLKASSARMEMWSDWLGNPGRPGALLANPSAGINFIQLYPPYTDGVGSENILSLQGRQPGANGSASLLTDGILRFVGLDAIRGESRTLIRFVTQDAALNPAGEIRLNTLAFKLDNLPTGGTIANLAFNPGTNQVTVIPSSYRFKQDVEPFTIDLPPFKTLQTSQWRVKGDVERDPDTARVGSGVMAEDVAVIPSLRRFVEYDADGEVHGLDTDRLFNLGNNAWLKELDPRVGQLEADKAALEATVSRQQEQLDVQAAQIAALTARFEASEAA